MKTTRHSAFETNSSSTHSISIDDKSTLLSSITPSKNGVIYLRGGKFGWEWQRITDPLTKANYCAVSAESDEDRTQMLKEVIMEHTGAKEVVISISIDDYSSADHSYIDHQSYGTADVAFASKEQLKNFIFSPESFLFTGNDNSTPPPNFYDKHPEAFTHYVKLEGTQDVYYADADVEKNEQKFESIIRSLFDRSIYYKYSSFNQVTLFGTCTTTREDASDYHLLWSDNDKEKLIDFQKKTVAICSEYYDRNKDKYVCKDKKFLKYEILPR